MNIKSAQAKNVYKKPSFFLKTRFLKFHLHLLLTRAIKSNLVANRTEEIFYGNRAFT